MIENAMLAVLLLMLVMGTLASTGWDVFELRNRENWWFVCILGIEALLMENQYAGLLLAVNVLGLWQIGRSWYVLRSTIIPMAACAGIYALVTPHLKLWMIPYVLWACVGIGLYLAAWAALGWYVTRRPFRFMLPPRFKWFGMWGWYEDLSGGLRHLCGQAHRIHLSSLAALAMAAAAGLVWMGQWWAAPAFLVCYLPMHVTWLTCDRYAAGDGRRQPHVGHLALIAVGIAGIALVDMRAAGLTMATGLGIAATITLRTKAWQNPLWVDSGRLAYWRDVFTRCYWPFGWKHRLFGFGTCTWFLRTCYMGDKLHKQIFTAAHNEYLQQLVEHGLVGLGIMLLYLGEAFWRLSHGQPPQQAIALMGAAWCAIALVNFPVTFYHEYHPAHEKKEVWYGSPPLNVWTLVLAMLAEAR